MRIPFFQFANEPVIIGFMKRAEELGYSEEQALDMLKIAAGEEAQAPAKPAAQPMPMEQTTTKQLADGSIELRTTRKLVPGSPEYDQFMQQQQQQQASQVAPPAAAPVGAAPAPAPQPAPMQ
jgi:hypothetical protein